MDNKLKEYLCMVCARPQPTNHPKHGGICCNACASFFQRTVFMEPSLKCKRDNSCFNSATKMSSSCRKCRYSKCLEVGMPFPKLTTVTAFTLTPEEKLICAYTVDEILVAYETNPYLYGSSFDKEFKTIFNVALETAKLMVLKNEHSLRITSLAYLFSTNPISMDNGLYLVCYIGICKLKFTRLTPIEREKVNQLQNDAYLKLENENVNLSFLFYLINISKQCVNLVDIFSYI